jgi:hypothetical protein
MRRAVVAVVAALTLRELRSAYSNFPVQEGMNVVAAPGGAAVLACADDVISTVPAGSEGTCGAGRPAMTSTPGRRWRHTWPDSLRS